MLYHIDYNMTKRQRVEDNVNEDNEIAFEEEEDDSSAPGVEAEFDVVTIDSDMLRLAVKPPTTPQNIVLDILIGCDATGSMCGDGEHGMQSMLSNFDLHVDNSLKSSAENTNIHFFQFGETAKNFGSEIGGFFSIEDSKSVAKSIAKEMKFDDCFTNFEDATDYAALVAKKRALDNASDDLKKGVHRIFAILLFTDGSVNYGLRDASGIIENANSTIAESTSTPFSIFAVGLGGSTNPRFLSRYCQTGFWKHVSDVTKPALAFEQTLGRILSTINTYNVRVEMKIERGGQQLVEEAVHSKHFGLVTQETCRARIVELPIPKNLKLQDKITITTNVGFGNEFVTTVKVGTESKASTESSGLLEEAFDIEKAVDNLKNQMMSTNTSKEFYNTGSSGSYAVRSFMRSHQDLVQSTHGSSVGTVSYIQDFHPRIDDSHSFQSSLSQIES